MKPACVPCQRFFRPKKNGFAFIEGMPIGREAEPGLREPQSWKPYKAWVGDLWVCPDCDSEIVVGVGGGPFAEHYQPDFENRCTVFGAKLQINDC